MPHEQSNVTARTKQTVKMTVQAFLVILCKQQKTVRNDILASIL